MMRGWFKYSYMALIKFIIMMYWISLLYCWGDISYRTICLSVVNHSLQIYLSYSNNCWVFHPLCLEGFPRVYLVSYGWLFCVADLFMRFICGWYKYYFVDCIKFHKSWNCLIKVLKFMQPLFCSNIYNNMNLRNIKTIWSTKYYIK